MIASHDDQMLRAEFHAIAGALADEIKRAIAAEEAGLDIDDDPNDTDEERHLSSLYNVQTPPEVGRLISHLHEIGVELRARNLPPVASEQ
ncbi:MAG TPA: hypothetical protein VF600_00145 [Abditibacteriaceae bacterium]|jgi:hypothetical protein